MFRKKDLALIAGVLAIALAFYGVMWWTRSRQTLSGFVDISVDGSRYESIPIGETRTVRIEQENGDVNVIEVDAEGARMVFSSCKNQLCLEQGKVTTENWVRRSMGRAIICLPNRVLVELRAETKGQAQPDDDPPDV